MKQFTHSRRLLRRRGILLAGGMTLVAPRPARAERSHAPAEVSTQSPNQAGGDLAALNDLITTDMRYDPESPVLGNKQGDVTLIEFFDYRCPYCRLMAPRIVTLIGKNPDLRVVMKEYPILGAESILAAKVALVAARHDKYAQFHAAMYAFTGAFNAAHIFSIAESVGLERARLQREMNGDDILGELRRSLALGSLIGLQGTPAFIIGGRIVPGAVPTGVMQSLIRRERAGAQKQNQK